MRIRQAYELQKSGDQGKELVSYPLVQYYVFLNLLRGILGLLQEKPARKGHGLQFIENANLLECGAKIGVGTFSDLLKAREAPRQRGKFISLLDCLKCIPEFAGALAKVSGEERGFSVLDVKARIDGRIEIKMVSGDFDQEKLSEKHPQLAKICEPSGSPSSFFINGYKAENDFRDVRRFCRDYLWSQLHLIGGDLVTSTRWASPITGGDFLNLPREAYYFVASFILSSVARYEPELLRGDCGPNTDLQWVLREYLHNADRYFPHHMFNWISFKNMYFVSR